MTKKITATMKYLLTTGTILFVHSFICVMAATPIDSVDTLKSSCHSSGVGILYVLNDGAFEITNPINFSQNDLEINSNASSLTVDNSGGSSTELQVNCFIVGQGSCDIIGGNANSAYGVSAKHFTMNEGGILDTTGEKGSGLNIGPAGSFVQNGGTIHANGSSIGNVNGIQLSSAANIYNGLLKTTGGDANFAFGIKTTNSLTLHDGTVEAKGGNGTGAYGISTTNSLTLHGGTLEAKGGNGAGSYGINTTGALTIDGGILHATAGAGDMAYGIYHTGGIVTHNDGIINATGGATPSNHGFYGQFFNQNGGTINARAGSSGSSSHGMTGVTFTQTGGTLNVYGCDDCLACYGLQYNSFIQENGNVYATGGSFDSPASSTRALSTNAMTQKNGSLIAEGGDGLGNGGVYIAYTLTQDGGFLSATGGTARRTYGLETETINQGANGLIFACSGVSNDSAHGINVNTMNIGGIAQIERIGTSASILATQSLTFKNTSTLVPIVDLSNPDNMTASGLIQSSGYYNSTQIEDGAKVSPWFKNTQSLSRTSPRSVVFVNAPFGITGTFRNGGIYSGVTLAYTLEKIANDTQYIITVQRLRDIDDILPLIEPENTRTFVGLLDDYLTLNPGTAPLSDIMDFMDNSLTYDELQENAGFVGSSTLPQAYTKLTKSFLRLAYLTDRDMIYQLHDLSSDDQTTSSNDIIRGNNPVCGPARLINGQAQKWRLWGSSLYLQSSRFAPDENDFDDAEEVFGGVSVGAGKQYGKLSLAAAFHYLRGDYQATFSDIDFDNYGCVVGARLKDFYRTGQTNHWLNLTAGYTHGDIDQRNRDFLGTWKTSSPHANLAQTGFKIGHDRKYGQHLIVSPNFGLNYVYIRQSGYEESNASNLGLRVFGNSFNSLRPSVGMNWKMNLSKKLVLSGRTHFRYETLDNYSFFNSEFLSFPDFGFPTRGEDINRSSGDFGVGVDYKWRKHVTLMANYDVLIEDKYMAHQLIGSLISTY